MQNIAHRYFGGSHDLLLFKEVASGDSVLGKFDYVMVRHRPISDVIDDFVVIEFQTVDTWTHAFGELEVTIEVSRPMQLKEPQLTLDFDHTEQLSTERTDTVAPLIDTELDVEFANRIAEKESYNKHLYRPNTYLHKWWARRCGTTFRALLKQLVDNPSKRDFYSPGGLEGQVILDPMMGGGTTLHEAIRLGANVIGADIDPIPVLQARATLTYVSEARLRHEYSRISEQLRVRLGGLFATTCPTCDAQSEVRFVLYGVHRKCNCQEAILIDSYVLRHNTDNSVIHIDPDSYAILQDDRVVSRRQIRPDPPLLEKDGAVCTCGGRFQDLVDIPYYQRYEPIAVAGECAKHGFFFAAPQADDFRMIKTADERRHEVVFRDSDFSILPGPKSSDLLRRNITSYLDLFSSRQLLFFDALAEALQDVDPELRLKFALLVSTATEFNSMLCGYKGAGKNRPGAVRHTFTQHGYAFPYTALENNPLALAKSSGTLRNLFESRLIRGARWAVRPNERIIDNGDVSDAPIIGEIDAGQEVGSFVQLASGERQYLLFQGSSVHLDLPDDSVDHVVTDPLYFDSVQYGDLAAFFRVWLRQLLPSEVDWHYDLSKATVNQQVSGDGQYEAVLGSIFTECHRVLKKEHGRLIFTFHHWNPKGWADLTNALKTAGFVLLNRYVIHSENPASVHIVNQNALRHDVVLVLASRTISAAVSWPEPMHIDRTESYVFCEQCGSALGYFLQTSLDREAITQAWTELLK